MLVISALMVQRRPYPLQAAACVLLGVVLVAGLAHAAEGEDEAARQAVYERIARNPVLGLGAGRALLLQLAHPKIAAGVTDHSRVAADPSQGLARLRATASLGFALMLGDDEEAGAAAEHVNRVHDQVRGRVTEGTAAVAKGERYSAHDPRLQVWVLATLVDSMIRSHETFTGPLTAHEKDIFATEAFRRVGLRLKLRPEHLPTSYAQVRDQVREGLADGVELTPSAKRLGRSIAEPELPRRALTKAARLTTVGMLPAEVRDAYDLKWRPRDRVMVGAAAKVTRAAQRSPRLRGVAERAIHKVIEKAKAAGAR